MVVVGVGAGAGAALLAAVLFDDALLTVEAAESNPDAKVDDVDGLLRSDDNSCWR